jgi:transposase InsO family protein
LVNSIHVLLRRQELMVNHKKVQRVYRELKLTVKRTRRKRLKRELRPKALLTALAGNGRLIYRQCDRCSSSVT